MSIVQANCLLSADWLTARQGRHDEQSSSGQVSRFKFDSTPQLAPQSSVTKSSIPLPSIPSAATGYCSQPSTTALGSCRLRNLRRLVEGLSTPLWLTIASIYLTQWRRQEQRLVGVDRKGKELVERARNDDLDATSGHSFRCSATSFGRAPLTDYLDHLSGYIYKFSPPHHLR